MLFGIVHLVDNYGGCLARVASGEEADRTNGLLATIQTSPGGCVVPCRGRTWPRLLQAMRLGILLLVRFPIIIAI